MKYTNYMKLTNTELLEEAYRRFPLGAKFLSTISDGGMERTVAPYEPKNTEMKYVVWGDDGDKEIYVDEGMCCNKGGCSNPTLYTEALGWCPIVGEQLNYEIY